MSDSEQDLSQLDEHMSNDEDFDEELLVPFDQDYQFQNSRLPTLDPSVFANNGTAASNPLNRHPEEKPQGLARFQTEDFVRALNSISVEKTFVDEFENKYGTLHPSFLYGPFNSALLKAKQHRKLIVVYVHTEATEGLNTLLDENVADYIDINFLFWVGNYVTHSPQIENLIRGMSSPIMAVIGIDRNGNTNVVEIMTGITNIDDLISRLMNVQENFSLAQQEANRERSKLDQILEKDRLLKLEQEQALLISQEADRRKQEEEEMMRVAILEQEETQRLEKERREKEVLDKQKRLSPEPTDPKQAADVIFRLSDGRKLQRKFNRTDTVEELYTYVQITCPEYCVEDFQLVVSFPKKVLTDRAQSLTAAGLVPQAMIHVQL